MANDKVLFENKWVSVIERTLGNGIKWVFGRHTWCNSQGIVILPFRRLDDSIRFLGRVEICPAHSDEPALCAIAGGLDKDGELPGEAAQRELVEEAGYTVNISDIIPLGSARPSKGTDTTMYLFAVDVSNVTPGKPTGDGSLIEQLASTKWINRGEAVFSKDPLLSTMVARLESYLG